jgi:hypothetical protein
VTDILGAELIAVGLPYAEELWRCYRTDRTLAAHWAVLSADYGAGSVIRAMYASHPGPIVGMERAAL